MERMVEKFSFTDYQSLQYAISESPWDTEVLMKQLTKAASDQMQQSKVTSGTPIGCIIDEKAFIKKGNKSAGVSRQYAGTIGKLDNCQVGVFTSLTQGKFSTLLNNRLFLPESWTDDKQRCLKAGIALEKTDYKSKPQLALEMIQELESWDVEYDFIGGDGLYGNGFGLMKGLINMKKDFVLDVHRDFHIYTQNPQIYLPVKEKGGKGKGYTRYQCNQNKIRADKYMLSLSESDFELIKIRTTTKGYLKAKIHITRVWVWDKVNNDSEAIELTLIIRKDKHKDGNGKIKYSISNIQKEQRTIEQFAYMQGQRFLVEKTFKDASHDLGMSDYQMRTFRGWTNHMAIVTMVMLFVTTQKIKHVEYAPLLSYNDVRQLLVSVLIDEGIISNSSFHNDLNRHKQHANDTRIRYLKQFKFNKVELTT